MPINSRPGSSTGYTQSVAPQSNILTPWISASGTWTVTSNSVTKTSVGADIIKPAGTPIASNVMISGSYTGTGNGWDLIGLGYDATWTSCAYWYFATSPISNAFPYYNATFGSPIVSGSWNASTRFSVTYDGLVFRYYADDVYKWGYSSSNQALMQPALRVNDNGKGFTNIYYGQLTGSQGIVPASVPAKLGPRDTVQTGGLPVTSIKFR